jgi:hypothetical protein
MTPAEAPHLYPYMTTPQEVSRRLKTTLQKTAEKLQFGVQKTAESVQNGGGSAMQISNRLALAVARYLCQHRSVGLYRLVDDLLRDSALLPAFAEVGAVEVVGGAPTAPRPGTLEWWRAYSAVRDAALYLETRGVVKYLPKLEVVNWRGKPCGSPTPTPTFPPPENSTPTEDAVAEGCSRPADKVAEDCRKSAVGVAGGGRKGRTLVDFL